MRTELLVSSPRRVFAAALLGTLLLQGAWILALPAFRGIDEIDHVYRASAVAHGQLLSRDEASNGPGVLVSVARDLVGAAAPACESRHVDSPGRCTPEAETPDGRVDVVSSAAAYNPVYYAVAGTVARPWHGVAALYVMRLTTAALCALLIAAAAATLARSRSASWPLVALGTTLTPVLVYSTTVVSPNGVHYSAALLTWSAALALARAAREGSSAARHVWLGLVVGAALLVCTHTTGAMWLVTTVVACVLLVPRATLAQVPRGERSAAARSLGVVLVVLAVCLWWSRWASTNALGPSIANQDDLSADRLVRAEVLWVFQTVAAFPMRNELAPAVVYLSWLAAWLVVLAAFAVRGTARDRLVGLLLAATSLVVPTVLSVIAYPSVGLAWQGRYGLPLTVGLLLLAGTSLARLRPSVPTAVVLLVGTSTLVAHTVSVASVLRSEAATYGVDALAGQVPHGAALVVALCLAASAVTGTCYRRHTMSHDRGGSPTAPQPLAAR